MGYNTKKMIGDQQLDPVPQYFNAEAGVDAYEVLKGKDGAIYVIVKDFLATVDVNQKGSASLTTDLATVANAGTRVQLPDIPCREVTVIAKDTNTGVIFAGGSSVSSTSYGVKLKADGSYTFNVSNAYLVWIDASVSGEGISFVAV